ncbi:hypothetical protein [Acinetobacter sp. CFCC 10889]|uniref:hypothetical protein n=1 Tax=Acinetobacter sp. CFCC 10889 TaxID=1775557 RepID=UPI0013A6B2B4|nr:hypothetical protein [Acinetobacter sp. CFCC 10889]
MKTKIERPMQPDWWTKTLVGAILGLSLSTVLSSLVFVIGLNFLAQSTIAQIAMWCIAWFWLPLFFLSYLCRTGKHALLFFSIANVIAFALLFGLRA